jgi:hypothetical protein
MTGVAAPASRLAWLVPLAVNSLFGCLAIFPLGLVWYFLANHPLAALGLTERDPTDNDGIVPHLLVLLVVGVFVALWAAVNWAIRVRSRLPVRLYWLVSAALLLAPSVLIVLSFAAYHLWKASTGRL